MNTDEVIVTDCPEFVPLITKLGKQSLQIPHPPIDLDKAGYGYTPRFVPVFRIENPKVATQLKQLRKARIFCVTRPRLDGMQLPYSVKWVSRSDQVFHVPLWVASVPALSQALEKPVCLDGYGLTEYIGRRITERLLGRRIATSLNRHNHTYLGASSYLLLYLIASLSKPSWQVDLFFGSFRMKEVDPFWAIKIYSRLPDIPRGNAKLHQIERESYYPNLSQAYHQLILNAVMAKMELNQVREELTKLYAAGVITYPFSISDGIHSINRQRFDLTINREWPDYALQIVDSASPLLAGSFLATLLRQSTEELHYTHLCRECIRFYVSEVEGQKRFFRGISYYAPEDPMFSPINPISKKASFRQEACPLLPNQTFANLIQRLNDLRLLLDLQAYLKLTFSELVAQDGDILTVTPRGEEVLDILRRNDVSFGCLYMPHKLWEQVGLGCVYSYDRIMPRICQQLSGRLPSEAKGNLKI